MDLRLSHFPIVSFFYAGGLMKYIYALDLSLSNTGVCIFDLEGNPIDVFSISTSPKFGHPERLKIIADILLEKRKIYPTNTIVLESGFFRFNKSTQAIYKVIGLVSYLFYNCNQTYYPPSSVKKIISGNGEMSKEGIRKIVSKKFPELNFENDDQSDACAIGVCFFMERKND